MRPRSLVALALVTAVAFALWHSQLFTVSRPGEAPRPLVARPAGERPEVSLDVVLPTVPIGMRRLEHGHGVLLVHYWAMWERDGASQAAALDSLTQLGSLAPLDVAVVCFDPFPSVARFVGRHRLRLPVLLDGGGALRRALPCPSVPYTYVLDRDGRVAVAQAGNVAWLSPGTRRTLERLLAEPARTGASARVAAPVRRGGA